MSTSLWERYLAGQRYQNTMGFSELFPKCIRFREGDQWPPVTEKTRNLPRPVINLVDFFIRTKRASILNQTLKMVYSPAEGPDGQAEEGARRFSDYAASLWNELEQDELNESLIDDAATVGTGILHYYWDNDVLGGARYPFKGALRGEALDPLTVFFSDPQCADLQKQRWILIAQRHTVEAVRRLARALGWPEQTVEQIISDDEPAAGEQARHEPDSEEDQRCTLLTMYYRKNGEVVFDRATRSVLLLRGQRLTPGQGENPAREGNVGQEGQAGQGENAGPGEKAEQGENPGGIDRMPEEPAQAATDRITLYPIVLMGWYPRRRCIFGIGEAQGILNSQQAVNWLMGMNILSAQDLAWPKLLVREGALDQTVTNEPGEILTDHSPSGDGIRYLNPPNFSGFAVSLVDKLQELLRTTSGVSEVASGDPFTRTMAASAIIALQNQAKKPIEQQQKKFYRAVRQVGRIWEQFFKTYYSLPRPYEAKSVDGRRDTGTFLGTDFAGISFALEVDVSTGSDYSEALAQSTLDRLFEGGHIDLDTYIELCPKSVMPFRETLRQRRELAAQMAAQPGGGAGQMQGGLPAFMAQGNQAVAQSGGAGQMQGGFPAYF